MYCEKCGAKLEDKYIFCDKCGAKIINHIIEEVPTKIIAPSFDKKDEMPEQQEENLNGIEAIQDLIEIDYIDESNTYLENQSDKDFTFEDILAEIIATSSEADIKENIKIDEEKSIVNVSFVEKDEAPALIPANENLFAEKSDNILINDDADNDTAFIDNVEIESDKFEQSSFDVDTISDEEFFSYENVQISEVEPSNQENTLRRSAIVRDNNTKSRFKISKREGIVIACSILLFFIVGYAIGNLDLESTLNSDQEIASNQSTTQGNTSKGSVTVDQAGLIPIGNSSESILKENTAQSNQPLPSNTNNDSGSDVIITPVQQPSTIGSEPIPAIDYADVNYDLNITYRESEESYGITIKSLKAGISGSLVEFALEYESSRDPSLNPIDCNYSFFNPPNGSVLMKQYKNALKKGTNVARFSLTMDELNKVMTVDSITMRFGFNDYAYSWINFDTSQLNKL